MGRIIKCISLSLVVAGLVGGVFIAYPGAANAAKKTKWQTLLEKNNVNTSIWRKYLPRVSRQDYNKVKKILKSNSGPTVAKAAKKTKWQSMLEKNNVDAAIWQKYLPKISRKDYNKVKKALRGHASPAAAPSLGPEISVGLWNFNKSDTFRISANRTYNIKNKDGEVVAQIPGETETKVEYDDDGKLKVFGSIAEAKIADDRVSFEAADGDNSSMVFDVNTPGDSYDHYRGTIEVNYWHGEDIYNKSSSTVTQIWVINKLPIEQYVWGMGETTGTGPEDHVRVMTTIFRTYGFWYIENATKYKPLGFKIRSDAGSQIYGGYDWEQEHPNIRKAADETRAHLVMYKGKAALTPFCSYTDGKTRNYPDDDYPYLKSVKDHKAGVKNINPGDGGNHMWGLSAHGALGYAKDGKSWTWILNHYYSNVDVSAAY